MTPPVALLDGAEMEGDEIGLEGAGAGTAAGAGEGIEDAENAGVT
ncbi:MAG TPA: hypothetical protein VIC00_01255 [Candidatus Acidoferrales bacterium]